MTRANTMISGRYKLEVRFTGKTESVSEIELELYGARTRLAPGGAPSVWCLESASKILDMMTASRLPPSEGAD